MTATAERTMLAHDWVKEAHDQARTTRRALLEALYGIAHASDEERADAATEVVKGIDAATAAVSNLGAALEVFGVEPYPDPE